MEIGIWGDSITYGECDSEGLGWVGRFRKSFPVEEYVGVYNRGICGDTSNDLLKRFSVEAESIKPEQIIFAIGINDSKIPAGQTTNFVSMEIFRQNIAKLLEQAKTYTEKIYVVGATKVDDSLERSSGSRFVNQEIRSYNATLQEIAREQGLPFIDVFEVLTPGTDLADGLHPNAQGYEKLFVEIAAKLK